MTGSGGRFGVLEIEWSAQQVLQAVLHPLVIGCLGTIDFRRVLAAQRLSDHLNGEGVEYHEVFRIANQLNLRNI